MRPFPEGEQVQQANKYGNLQVCCRLREIDSMVKRVIYEIVLPFV